MNKKSLSLLLIVLIAVAGAYSVFKPNPTPGVIVRDAFIISTGEAAKAASAYMQIENTSTTPDRLVQVKTQVAPMAELHSSTEDANGVMQMLPAHDGFEIAGKGTRSLSRGADHVMLMGLQTGLIAGGTVEMTLTFERAGEVTVAVPVREP